jgi:repressor LexA
MIGLTPRQRDILNYLKFYHAREGIAPTLNEIARRFKFTTVTAFGHLRALEKKGHIKRARGRVRALEIIEPDDTRPRASLPVYGHFTQGAPLVSAAEYEELDARSVLPPGKDLFVLRVQSDSLAAEGIREGDYLVLERKAKPENDSTALVLANGSDAVLGTYHREGESRIRIEPLGGHLPTIRAGRALLQGTVIALVRRL